MTSHHMPEEFLLDYAAGTLPEAVSLVVASHLAMCGDCRRRVAELEEIGAALMDVDAIEVPGETALGEIFDRIDNAPDESDVPAAQPIEFGTATLKTVPAPLRSYLGSDLSDLSWKKRSAHMEEARLAQDGDTQVSLLRIGAGRKVPVHTHGGEEFTLVLSGGYSDANGHYIRGDVSVTDGTVEHAPVADDDEPCLCLTVRVGRTRLTGPIARMFNPLIRS